MGAFDKTLVLGAEGAGSKVFEQPVKLVGKDGAALDYAVKAPAVADVATDADAPAVAAALNSLLASLRAAGVLAKA